MSEALAVMPLGGGREERCVSGRVKKVFFHPLFLLSIGAARMMMARRKEGKACKAR